MDLGLRDKVALVTGASKGIGHAIAAELAHEGALVAISSRSHERVEAAAEGLGVLGLVHDGTDRAGVPGLVAAVERELGPIDVLVCNTGGPPTGGPLDFPPEQWQEAYETLVLGPMALVEAVLPGMRARGWGRVVNVAGTSVREPLPTLMLSNAHRVSMIAAFKTLARETTRDGVTLNTVLPGLIATERIVDVFGSPEQAAETMGLPAGRLGTVEEMAAAAAFLCSDRAGYVSGEMLAVDGSMTHSL